MSDLQDLYQEVILDHNRSPRNYGSLENADHHAKGHNPLCGDHISLWVRMGEAGTIDDIGFEGEGCAISKASASLMTDTLRGRNRDEAQELFDAFQALVTGKFDPANQSTDLGKLKSLGGVSEFPMRVKCATLAWHTLNAAWNDDPEPATTE